MDTFEAYERQFVELADALARTCKATASLSGDQRTRKLRELHEGVEDAESLIRQMDLEARSHSPSERGQLLARLRRDKMELLNIKKDVKALNGQAAGAGGGGGSATAPNDRAELLEGGDYMPLSDVADQRSRLLHSSARLDESSSCIADGRRTLLQTEQLGVTILQDLHQQRQSLIRAGDTLEEMDSQIGRSRQILNAMVRKMHRNKYITGLILVVLMLAIGLVIYLNLRH